MKPIEFKESNVIYGKEQPEYLPLPAFKDNDGTVITSWQLSPEEIEKVRQTGCIWLAVRTFNEPMQPLFLTADKTDLDVYLCNSKTNEQ